MKPSITHWTLQVILLLDYLQAGMGLTTSCVKYCCSSSWKMAPGGRPRRLAAAAAARAPLRAGLLPLLPLLLRRVARAGARAGLGRVTGAGRSCGGGSTVESAASAVGMGTEAGG